MVRPLHLEGQHLGNLIHLGSSYLEEGIQGKQNKTIRKLVMAAKIHVIPLGDEETIEVEMEILDKVIPHAFVDGGTCITIMPLSTLKKLGLDMIGPSAYFVNMAYQRRIMPVEQMAYCKVRIGGEVYTLFVHVLHLVPDTNSYPILLGRNWLQYVDPKICWSTNRC